MIWKLEIFWVKLSLKLYCLVKNHPYNIWNNFDFFQKKIYLNTNLKYQFIFSIYFKIYVPTIKMKQKCKPYQLRLSFNIFVFINFLYYFRIFMCEVEANKILVLHENHFSVLQNRSQFLLYALYSIP
jgi:hypothetical protein